MQIKTINLKPTHTNYIKSTWSSNHKRREQEKKGRNGKIFHVPGLEKSILYKKKGGVV